MTTSNLLYSTIDAPRKFVTSRTAKVYHWITEKPSCEQHYRLGVVAVYKARCGKEFFAEQVNDLAPRPSTTECFRCGRQRLAQEKRAVEAAEREVRGPKTLLLNESLEAVLKKVEEMRASGYLFVEVSYSKRWYGKKGEGANLHFYTPEQVKLARDEGRNL